MKGKKVRKDFVLDIAPLVDMVFLLLIFFLLTNTYEKPSIDVSLPKAPAASVEGYKKKNVVITITKEGKVLLDGQEVNVENFFVPKGLTVKIEADEKASYGTFVKVLNRLKELKVEGVEIVARKE